MAAKAKRKRRSKGSLDPLPPETTGNWPATFADLQPQLAPSSDNRGEQLYAWLLMLPPVRWPQEVGAMDPDSRSALVLHLCGRGFQTQTIAEKLSLPLREIDELWRSHLDSRGRQAIGYSLPVIVGRVETRAAAMVERAMHADDLKTAWRIEKERVEVLQSLGIVERAAQRYEVEHHHEVSQGGADAVERKAEIERILELERKGAQSKAAKDARRIEMIEEKPRVEDVED